MAQPARVKACVAEVICHAPDLHTIVLEAMRRVPRFAPGQFLHLAVDAYDPSEHWPDSRCFSIASPPQERKTLRLTVSTVGVFTRKVNELLVGDEVWIKLPYGEFVIGAQEGETVVLVAGGTGIAPFMSFIESAELPRYRLRTLYGARRPELLIYASHLDDAQSRWPDFDWKGYLEEGDHPNAVRGRLSVDAVLAEAGDPSQCRIYLSGPPEMLSTFRAGLESSGVPTSRILTDAWE